MDNSLASLALMTVDLFLLHRTVQRPCIIYGIWINQDQAGLFSVRDGDFDLVSYYFQDVRYVETRGHFLGNSEEILKSLFVHEAFRKGKGVIRHNAAVYML